MEYIKPNRPHDGAVEWAKAFYLIDTARRAQKPITIYTRTRNYIDTYKAIDRPNKPVTLNSWTVSGGLIYYKSGDFDWKTISFDDVLKIETEM